MTRRLWCGGAILAALVWLLPSESPGQAAPPSPAKSASEPRGPLDKAAAAVTARCQLRSDAGLRVRCEVLGTGGEGVMILEVVPEGTLVKKGDVILRFDASALEDRQMEQEVLVQKTLAAVVKATAAFEAAKMAMEEFVGGAYVVQEHALQREIAVAEEQCRQAQDALGVAQAAAKDGKSPPSHLERLKFTCTTARSDLGLAQRKLSVLQKLTKPKMVQEIGGAIKSADVSRGAAEADYDLQKTRLDRLKSQIQRCTVRAPQDGQVFYGTAADAETGRPVRIAEGARVRTFQEVARLRDPRQMRAVGRVPSAQAGRITPGLLVVVFLDALPAVKLSGVVDQVRDVSATAPTGPTREVSVCVVDPPEGLRSGMTGEMRIALPKP